MDLEKKNAKLKLQSVVEDNNSTIKRQQTGKYFFAEIFIFLIIFFQTNKLTLIIDFKGFSRSIFSSTNKY